jgi:hypothetical protein
VRRAPTVQPFGHSVLRLSPTAARLWWLCEVPHMLCCLRQASSKGVSYRVSSALLDVHIGHVANTAMSVGTADGVPPLQPEPVGRLRR